MAALIHPVKLQSTVNAHSLFSLPQINSRSLRLGANRRAEITDELVKASPMMLQLLVCFLAKLINAHIVVVSRHFLLDHFKLRGKHSATLQNYNPTI